MTAARDAKGGFVERVNTLYIAHPDSTEGFVDLAGVLTLAAEADAALTQQAALMEQMAGALKNCAGVLGGHDLSKGALVNALERSRVALAALAAYEGAKT